MSRFRVSSSCFLVTSRMLAVNVLHASTRRTSGSSSRRTGSSSIVGWKIALIIIGKYPLLSGKADSDHVIVLTGIIIALVIIAICIFFMSRFLRRRRLERSRSSPDLASTKTERNDIGARLSGDTMVGPGIEGSEKSQPKPLGLKMPEPAHYRSNISSARYDLVHFLL